MKHLLLTALCVIATFVLSFSQNTNDFTMRTVRCNMQMPWEITYGPDNHLWTTEARGYLVSRVNPADGSQSILLDLSNKKNFTNFPTVSPQGGLMGLALHPQLLTGKPYVYLAYVYQFDNCKQGKDGCFFKTKVVRYTYNANAQTLTNEEIICDTIPGSNDHNGGRMTIATIEGQTSLFYSVGDMGAGQFGNATRLHNAQNPNSYEGKILRFNLQPDADTGNYTKWIPDNNPFGATNAVWSIGHRNPQGLVFGNGKLYEAEHGPYSDDELNVVERGANYGFPLVVGLANDGNYNGIAVGEGNTVPIIQSEQQNAANLGATYRDPIKAFFQNNNANLRPIYENAINNVPNDFLSWNSIAPSGIDYYNSSAIPNWKNSVLVTSLKRRRVYRMQLNDAGTAVISDTIPLFQDMGRFRDVAISPDGTRIYVSCDSEGQTSGPTAGTSITPINRGCILEFKYNNPTPTPIPTPTPTNKDALAINITATPSTYKMWSYVKVNVEVTAKEAVQNANVELQYPDATKDDFVLASEPDKMPTVSQGIFSTPFWTIGNMPAGGKATFSYYLFMKVENKKLTLAAKAGAFWQNIQSASTQIGQSVVITPPNPTPTQGYALTLSATPTNYKQWNYVTLTTAITNNTGADQTNLTIATPLPSSNNEWVYAAEANRINAPAGTTFDTYSGTWRIASLKKGETLTLISNLYARVAAGKSFTVTANVVGKNTSKSINLGTETEPPITNTVQNDLAIRITTAPDKANRSITYFVEATNVGKNTLSNIVYKLTLPNGATVGITQKVASEMTKFREYCSDGSQCTEWNITSLATTKKATLTLTYYVKDVAASLDAAISYKTSSPLDQNTINNTANIKTAALSTRSETQLVASRAMRLYPTLAQNEIHIDLLSEKEYSTTAQIFSLDGTLAHQESVDILKGDNQLEFFVDRLPAGMYILLLPNEVGMGSAMKFIKTETY